MTPEHPCAQCRERLPWFAAATLSPSERDDVERHLAGCDACRREAPLWREAGPALRDVLDSPPPDIHEDEAWQALQARLPQRRAVEFITHKERADMSTLDTPPAARSPGTSPLRRRRPPLAVAAAMLIVVLSATLFAVLGSRIRHGQNPQLAATITPAATATPTTTSCAPGQITAHLPPHADLLDVSMISATDGWAVGQIWDPQSGTLPRTLMAHFARCQWSQVGPGIASASLLNVAMTSPDDGWALGTTAQPAGPQAWQPDQPILLHYTHGAWQRAQLTNGHQLRGQLLRMISPDEGWISLTYTNTQGSILFHYQNGVWARVPLPPQLQGADISDLASSAPDDWWVVANISPNHINPVIAHYSAGHWQFWGGALFSGLMPTLYTVRIAPPASVWVLGTYSYQNATGSTSGSFILRYDGSRWTRVTVTGLGSPPPEFSFWSTALVSPDGGMLLLGSANFPQVPDNPNVHSSQQTLVLRCAGDTCHMAAFPVQGIIFVSAVSLYTPTQGVAIGCRLDPVEQFCFGILLAYDGGAWSIVPGQ